MIELWREALRSLPSETFLDLMRAYLGPVRTPYRKHELIEELESFLRKKETVDRIVSLLDEADCACLSAVLALGGADRGTLVEFLGGDRGQTLSRIVNLEERLLAFEAPASSGPGRPILVNPLLAECVRRYAFDPALAFPPPGLPAGARTGKESGAAFPSLERLDPAAVAAMVSFFLDEERAPRRKADGEWKVPAKATREFEAAFPSGWDSAQAAGFLEAAGLFRAEDGKFEYRQAQAQAFFSSDGEAFSKAAAIAAGLPGAASLARETALSMPPERAFSLEAVIRFVIAAQSRRVAAGRSGRKAAEALASGMIRSGMLIAREGSEGGYVRRADAPGEGRALVHVGSDYHIVADSRLSAPDLLFLAQCLDLKRLGAALELGLSRRSAARAYRLGSGKEAMEARLARLSGAPLPQNLSYSLDSWEREHRSVNIASGIVVFGDERLARFMEHSPAMKERVLERLSAGAYLTDFPSVEECEKALQRAGLETPPRLLRPTPPSPFAAPSLFPEGPAETWGAPLAARVPAELEWGKAREKPPLDQESLLAELAESLEKAECTKDTREALAERLRLKLVIGAAGLRPDSVRYDRSEAGGLDYLGKVKLIERALHEPNWLLDILFRSPDGQPERLTARPLSLHKSPSGLILECRSDEGADGEEGRASRIAVDKISNVKRIRLSLFG